MKVEALSTPLASPYLCYFPVSLLLAFPQPPSLLLTLSLDLFRCLLLSLFFFLSLIGYLWNKVF